MKKMILPLGILAATLAACDKGPTAIAPGGQTMQAEQMTLSTEAMAGTWYGVEYDGVMVADRNTVTLVATPSSANSGSATLTLTNSGTTKMETVDYRLSNNNEILFAKKAGTMETLSSSPWTITTLTSNRWEMRTANGTVARFAK